MTTLTRTFSATRWRQLLQKNEKLQMGLLLFLATCTMFANIGGLSLYVLDEAKNATCASEMLVARNFIVPTFNGELRTDKPPLHYYAMMVAYKVLGTTPLAARFFSSLCGVLVVLLTYLFTRRHLNHKAALFAGLSLVASIQVAVQFHLAVPDPYLILLVSAALMGFYHGYLTQKTMFLYLGYVFLGLATLAKGPMAIVLPGATVGLFLLLRKDFQWKTLCAFKPIQGLVLLLAVAMPWYVLVTLETQGEWLESFIFKHNLNRYAAPMEGHGGPFFLPFVFVFSGLFPFSIFLPQALGAAIRQRAAHPLLLFALLTMGVFTVFFAFSGTKLPSYPAPCFPFVAMLLGHYLQQVADGECSPTRLSWGISLVILALLTFSIPAGVYAMLIAQPDLNQHAPLALWLIPPALLVGWVMYPLWKKPCSPAIYLLALAYMLIGWLFFVVLYPPIDRENPVMASQHLLNATEGRVGYYKKMNPAFVFYLGTTVQPLEDLIEVAQFLQEGGGLVISTKAFQKELEELPLQVVFEQQDLFEKPVSLLLRPRSDREASAGQNP